MICSYYIKDLMISRVHEQGFLEEREVSPGIVEYVYQIMKSRA
jgi:hypothetical protein